MHLKPYGPSTKDHDITKSKVMLAARIELGTLAKRTSKQLGLPAHNKPWSLRHNSAET